jgi:hypothetical protein
LNRLYLVVVPVVIAVFAFAGCGGDSGGGNGGGGNGGAGGAGGADETAQDYLAQVVEIAQRVGELDSLLGAVELGDDAAGSYAEELRELQQSAKDLIPPEALRDAHESYVEGIGGLADSAAQADVAAQAGDEEALTSAKGVSDESSRLIIDALREISRIRGAGSSEP